MSTEKYVLTMRWEVQREPFEEPLHALDVWQYADEIAEEFSAPEGAGFTYTGCEVEQVAEVPARDS